MLSSGNSSIGHACKSINFSLGSFVWCLAKLLKCWFVHVPVMVFMLVEKYFFVEIEANNN